MTCVSAIQCRASVVSISQYPVTANDKLNLGKMETDDLGAMVPLADQIDFARYVIVGGGIAGVSCAEMLSTLCPNERVLLISASPTVKAVTNISNLTKLISTFDIDEQSAEQLEARHHGVSGN